MKRTHLYKVFLMEWKWKISIALLVLFSTLVGTAQEPPAVFKFDIASLSSEPETFFQNYEVSTLSLRDSIYTETVDVSLLDFDYRLRNINSNLIYLYIYGETILMPKEKDIIRFSLKNRQTDELMNVFIRLGHNMGFGEQFELMNLSFVQGDFFIDQTGAIKKYRSDEMQETAVDLTDLKKHKISIKRLDRLIRKGR